LVQWCGSDFDGLLVFDEVYKAHAWTYKPPTKEK
jgi:hypothetical protein